MRELGGVGNEGEELGGVEVGKGEGVAEEEREEAVDERSDHETWSLM